MNRKIVITSSICFILDVIVKYIVEYFNIIDKVIIKDFFYIRLVYNKGAAFSVLTGNTILLVFIGVLSIIFIYKYFKDENSIYLGLLYGGILGNMYDRVVYGYVRDYLDFYIFGYDYPVFNIADMCICLGVILIFIDIVRKDKNGSKSIRRKDKNR